MLKFNSGLLYLGRGPCVTLRMCWGDIIIITTKIMSIMVTFFTVDHLNIIRLMSL